MKNKNGFVFMETIVVVSVLSVTLLLLFSSYSYILRKSRERNSFDTTEMIYKTYYIKKIIDTHYKLGSISGSERYKTTASECKKMGSFNSYECTPTLTSKLNQVKLAYDLEKIYFVNPSQLFSSSQKDDWLYLFDATTIDYLKEIGGAQNQNLLIAKYKKEYQDRSYEVIHSSIGVE